MSVQKVHKRPIITVTNKKHHESKTKISISTYSTSKRLSVKTSLTVGEKQNIVQCNSMHFMYIDDK